MCWRMFFKAIYWSYFSTIISCVVQAVDVGKPLYVTPLVEKGSEGIAEAVKSSRVSQDILGTESYSGFFTVNEKCGSNLFFWFFPAESNWESSPLILWLSGGSGDSAISGAFEDLGPWQIENGNVKKRMYPGTSRYNTLFLDTIPGLGFSFTQNQCYANTVNNSVKETYLALSQFYAMFHELARNKLIITGRYFVSHFGPALAVLIKEKQKSISSVPKVDMKGVLIINPRTNYECHDFSDQIFQLGIVDHKGRDQFKDLYTEVGNKAKRKQFVEAANIERTIFKKLSGEIELPSYHNFVAEKDQKNDFLAIIVNTKMRKLLHVGNIEFVTDSEVAFKSFLAEYYSSPKQNIEALLKSKEVYIGFYNGQLDIISSYAATLCFLKTLKWPESPKLGLAQRYQWFVNNEMVGWYKVAGTLLQVLVRKQGHFLSLDQSEAGLTLVEAMLSSNTNYLMETLSQK